MSTAVAKRPAAGLESLAAKIRKEHEACERNAQSAVEHAIKAGELLTIAKAKVKHGGWLPWLEEHFEFTQQTASVYVRLAQNYGGSRSLPDSISEALAELGPAHTRDTAPPETSEAPEPPTAAPDPEPSDPDDDVEEVVDAEIVEEPPGLPSGMERVDHGTLRAVVNNLTAQARTTERMLDNGFTVESQSPEDEASVKGDMDRVLSVATRVKEAITEEASSANDA